MKITVAMVMSINGKITRRDELNIYEWTSKEDQQFFSSLLRQHNLIIMGSDTYKAAQDKIIPSSKRRRVILTHTPAKYEHLSIPEQIEFRNISPKELIETYQQLGYDSALLIGGGKTNTAFFEQNVVDEMYITIEPLLFGTGKSLVAEGSYLRSFTLLEMQKLNSIGTLLLRYKKL